MPSLLALKIYYIKISSVIFFRQWRTYYLFLKKEEKIKAAIFLNFCITKKILRSFIFDTACSCVNFATERRIQGSSDGLLPASALHRRRGRDRTHALGQLRPLLGAALASFLFVQLRADFRQPLRPSAVLWLRVGHKFDPRRPQHGRAGRRAALDHHRHP